MSSDGLPPSGVFVPTRKHDYTVEDFRKGADFLRSRTSHRPKLACILGSGMGEFVDAIHEADVISYEEVRQALPYFPMCSVSGHKGNFIFGKLEGSSVMVMQGRFHLYEGHSVQAVTYPVRMMKEMGIEVLILTNAAGGLSTNLRVGDVMLITDHFNTAWGTNHPLIGPNVDPHGPRFLPCSNVYDRGLRKLAVQVAREAGVELRKGVYIFTSGPSYETPLEVTDTDRDYTTLRHTLSI
jgi:purine-nucleoside phosphorylase